DDVRAAAERYLDPEAVSALVYLPRDRGEDLTADQVARTFAVTELGANPAAAGSAPAARAPAPATGRTRAGVLHVALPGADLLLRRKSGVPTVDLGLYVP